MGGVERLNSHETGLPDLSRETESTDRMTRSGPLSGLKIVLGLDVTPLCVVGNHQDGSEFCTISRF